MYGSGWGNRGGRWGGNDGGGGEEEEEEEGRGVEV